jgi:hypothetical protein
VNIVEDNALSTKVGDPSCTLGDPLCINATLLGSNTDAVGDMNVMVTLNPAWCLDMSGTNTNDVTGPTHTYARYGNGLIIYNGFDIDVMSATTPPINTLPAGNLAKIWLQELQVAFAPTPAADLPCGIRVVGITLTPENALNDLSLNQTSHTVTATVTELTSQGPIARPGLQVTFTVLSGPNSGASGTCSVDPSCVTDSDGQVSFTYSSDGTVGIDKIEACIIDPLGQEVCSNLVEKEWIATGGSCDVDGDGDIDKLDLREISSSRGQTPTVGDPRDANGDGVIDIRDTKICITQCTLLGCAVQ